MEPAERLLTALCGVLDVTDRLIARCGQPAFWTPRPSSVFDRELLNTEVDQHNRPWGPEEPRYAYEMAQLSMMVIGDHLAGIRKLLQPPFPIFGQAVLARSVFGLFAVEGVEAVGASVPG